MQEAPSMLNTRIINENVMRKKKQLSSLYWCRYQWFVRADDDAYIKTAKLEKFLRNLNSSEPIFLGQTGLGNAEVSCILPGTRAFMNSRWAKGGQIIMLSNYSLEYNVVLNRS